MCGSHPEHRGSCPHLAPGMELASLSACKLEASLLVASSYSSTCTGALSFLWGVAFSPSLRGRGASGRKERHGWLWSAVGTEQTSKLSGWWAWLAHCAEGETEAPSHSD